MNRAVRLLAELRQAGAVLRLRGERIAIEAPAGVITAEMRQELASQKSELVSLLRISAEPQIDLQVTECLGEVAKLLAFAYQRYSRIHRVLAAAAPSVGLALSSVSSVHGDGQSHAG